jgi:hypothetical protein
VVTFTLRPLYSRGKNPWYAFWRTLHDLRARLDVTGKEKYLLALLGIEPRPSSPSLY